MTSGVGKTTVCAVWAQLLARDGYDVLAIDADPDTNLYAAFGLSRQESPEPLINMKALIGQRMGTGRAARGAYFRMNPKVSDLAPRYWHETHGVKVLVLGGARKGGAGCACAEGAFLRALIDNNDPPARRGRDRGPGRRTRVHGTFQCAWCGYPGRGGGAGRPQY